MAYNVKVNFDGSWLWMIDGHDNNNEPTKATFETYDQARDVVRDAKPGYFRIVEV